jgi:hypothetical protein
VCGLDPDLRSRIDPCLRLAVVVVVQVAGVQNVDVSGVITSHEQYAKRVRQVSQSVSAHMAHRADGPGTTTNRFESSRCSPAPSGVTSPHRPPQLRRHL